MDIMRAALLSFFLLAATPVVAGSSYGSALPAGKIKVDVMQAVSSPRATELTAKLQSAVQHDREQWIANARGESQPEERLAWNENLGLTKAERDELHRLGSTVSYVKAGEAEIQLVHSKDGRVMIVADALPELNGIVIDTENDVVDTPFGRTTARNMVVANNDLTDLGTFNGEQWTLEVPGKIFGTGTTVKLAVGHLIYDGRAIISFEAKKIEEGQMPQRASLVLVFSTR